MPFTEERSLSALAIERGTAIECTANAPVYLSDADAAWFVETGKVDLFVIESEQGSLNTTPRHMLRAETGRFIPGMADLVKETTLGIMAKGSPGTVLRRVSFSDLYDVAAEELATQIDRWVVEISEMLSSLVISRPDLEIVVEPSLFKARGGQNIGSTHGVYWLNEADLGSYVYMSLIEAACERQAVSKSIAHIPVSSMIWLRSLVDVDGVAQTTESLVQSGCLSSSLKRFHELTLELVWINRRLEIVDEVNIARGRSTSRQISEISAREALRKLHDPTLDRDQLQDSALFEALQEIGRHENIEFKRPRIASEATGEDPFQRIIDASGIRARHVDIAFESNWWKTDNGALLGYRQEDDSPVALIPTLWGTYIEIDPATNTKRRVTRQRAAELQPTAMCFYQSLGSEPTSVKNVFSKAYHGMERTVAGYMITGLLASLTALVPVLVFGFVVDFVIPIQDIGFLWFCFTGLLLFAGMHALLYLLHGFGLMRFEAVLFTRMEASFWDRLGQLPQSVLDLYTTGDLGIRGKGIRNARNRIASLISDASLVLFLLIPIFTLVFVYDVLIGAVVLIHTGAYVGVIWHLVGKLIEPNGRELEISRQLVGDLFQIVNNIDKLRLDGAEGSAYAVWAGAYKQLKEAELRRGYLASHLVALANGLPLLSGGVLILVVGVAANTQISVGVFLILFFLFLMLVGAVVKLCDSVQDIAKAIPEFNQIQDLLEKTPERSFAGDQVEELGGEVLWDHVSYQREEGGPLILDDVTIRADPGEFVAITGRTGQGKSTLFRLALGLDAPSKGAVYYDGRDLKNLNIKQLRRKVGAVPQNVTLHPEDIWDNTVGDRLELSADEVWDALEQASMADEIQNLPMSMMTSVGATGNLLSGGERQRISIARALLGKPRVLILDEATCWLDNRKSELVMRSFQNLAATRIVIAHSPSALEEADRIYVIDSGKVAQVGRYAELVSKEGIFKDLVQREVV